MDRDGDGLSDYDEVHIHDTMPLDGDTDGDMLSDGDEINEFGSDPRKFDQDSDGDGFYWFEDCDDDDPLTKPSGIETWDGKDQDCDGSIDEGIDRLSELNHTVALLPWEASNVTFRLEPPDFPDGVVTVSQWRVNGATVNKTQEGAWNWMYWIVAMQIQVQPSCNFVTLRVPITFSWSLSTLVLRLSWNGRLR